MCSYMRVFTVFIVSHFRNVMYSLVGNNGYHGEFDHRDTLITLLSYSRFTGLVYWYNVSISTYIRRYKHKNRTA